MPDTAVPTDGQVDHLDKAVERAFAERDRLFGVWRETGRDEDEQAMEAQDRHADRLLTQYNAACQAQYAESDRRRAENLARYAEEQVARDMRRDGGGTFVDMPPPAQPFKPPPKQRTTPAPISSGAAVTGAVSYGSLKARVLGIADSINEQQGPLQQAIGGIDDLIANTQGATEESQALEETLRILMQVRQQCEEALGMLGQANNSASNAAAGLQ